MNTYKDFVNVHGITLDPRGVKMYIDWLLACDKDTQAYKIGEAMKAAVDNYNDSVEHNDYNYNGEYEYIE